MQLLTTLATVLTLSLSAAVLHAQESAMLNILCSAGTVYCETLARNYQKSTGTKVNMVAKSSGEVLAQISA